MSCEHVEITLGAIGAHVSLQFVLGETVAFKLVVKQDGVEEDLSGYSARHRFFLNGSTTPILELTEEDGITITGGNIVSTLSPARSSLFPETKVEHRLFITSPGGIVTCTAYGTYSGKR